MIKRLFDIIFSIIGLVLLMPLFFIIMVWIKFDSGGPILFRQDRVGRNNIDFKLFKFRSMKVGSHKKGLLILGNKDERITKFGYSIRKYKLDELPQLFNVFIGDMSFVGPRPDVHGYADQLTGENRKILELRPGITGQASLKYANEEEILANVEDPVKYNDEVIYPDKVKINLDYYYNHTFWGDLRIIIRTIL